MDHRPLLAALAALALTPLAACSGENSETPAKQEEQTLLDALGSAKDLSRFSAGLKDTDLEGIFAGPADYTVLAPRNEAFEGLGDDIDAPILAAALREHILPGTVTPDDIKAAIDSASGEPVAMATMGAGAVTFSLEDGKIVATSGDGRKAVQTGSPIRAGKHVVIPVDALLKETADSEP